MAKSKSTSKKSSAKKMKPVKMKTAKKIVEKTIEQANLDFSSEGRKILVPAIRNGTVIDHIPSRQTFKIMRLADPQEFEHIITVGLNLDSKKIGKKGVIKITDRFLTEDEFDKVAILAPQATVSIIKDFRVKEKIKVRVPSVINKIVQCSNPNCVTNIESVDTRFAVISEEPLKIRCDYCERTMSREDIKLK